MNLTPRRHLRDTFDAIHTPTPDVTNRACAFYAICFIINRATKITQTAMRLIESDCRARDILYARIIADRHLLMTDDIAPLLRTFDDAYCCVLTVVHDAFRHDISRLIIDADATRYARC